MEFNYTQQGRKPSAKQIVGAWVKAGKPDTFTVEYGETFAEFSRQYGRWQDSGNGQRGVNRLAVINLLSSI